MNNLSSIIKLYIFILYANIHFIKIVCSLMALSHTVFIKKQIVGGGACTCMDLYIVTMHLH